MSETQTQQDREEASLFSDKFTEETSSSDPTDNSNDYTPEENAAPNYTLGSISHAVESLNHNPTEITSTLSKEANSELLYADADERVRAEFTITLNTKLLKHTINSFLSLSEETFVSITEQGMLACGVDSSNTTMIREWIDAEDITYDDLTQNGITAINWRDLSEALTEIETGDTITLNKYTETTDGNDVDFLEISSGNESENIKVASLNQVRQPPTIPELTLTANIRLPLREIKTIINRCGEYSDHISFEGNGDNCITFSAEGDVTEITKTYKTENDAVTNLESIQPIQTQSSKSALSLFSIDLFEKYFKRIRKSQTEYAAQIRFGDEFPMKMQVNKTAKSFTTLMIAPRIQA